MSDTGQTKNFTASDSPPDFLAETVRELHAVTGGSTTCGWMCDEVARFVGALVAFHRPHLVIQTGHLWGKSAAAVLDGFVRYPSMESAPQGDQKFADFVAAGTPNAAKKRLISVDPQPMGVPHPHRGVAYLMGRYGEAFEFRQQTSADFFAGFKPEPHETRIMGIVDGDHSDAGCRGDLLALARMGAGLIVVDDTRWLPSLRDVTERFAFEYGYTCAVFGAYNGLAVLSRA